jgi:PAS domain S-box-containing protein
VLTAAYVAAAWLGLGAAIVHGTVSPVWPATGLAIAALTLWGLHLWPAIAAGAFVAGFFIAGNPLGVAAGIAVGNALEALAGAWVLRRVGVRGEISSIRDAAALLAVELLAPLPAVAAGVLSLSLGGLSSQNGYPWVALVWWLGDSLGAFIVLPLMLAWAGRRVVAAFPSRPAELAGATLLIVMLTSLAYLYGNALKPLGVPFLPPALFLFPPIVWALLRLRPRETMLVLAVGSTLAVIFTLARTSGQDIGPLLFLLMVLVSAGGGWLLLFGAIADRARVLQALTQSEARLRTLIDHAPAALALFDTAMRYVAVSRRWLSDYGLEGTPVVGRSQYEVSPEMPEHWRARHQRALAGEVLAADAERFERADGTALWLKWEMRPWHDQSGSVGGIAVCSEDITGQMMAHAALAERENELATALIGADLGTWSWEVGADVGKTSARCREMFGIDADEEAGLARFMERIHPDDRAGVQATFAAATNEQMKYRDEYRVIWPDGSVHWIATAGHVLQSAQPDAAPRVSGIVMDITARRQAAEELRTLATTLEQRVAERTRELTVARDAADDANRAKSQFLANMSHELRTPLNSLLILSQMLAQNASGNLDPKQVQYASVIHEAGSDLLVLINDLLDLAKIEAGRVTVNIEKVYFDALRESVQRSLGPLARKKGLAFVLELAPELPPAIRTDGVRLQQVLRNLIGNAVKFTSAGRVSLRIEPAGRSARQPIPARTPVVVAFSVTDTGIGITPEKQQLIFEAFQQADGSTARKYGGTGLGLSISREIAHLLGGELTLYSEPGIGSTFTLTLPLGYADRGDVVPSRLARREEIPSAALVAAAWESPVDGHAATLADDTDRPVKGRKVLLVDDDPRNLFVLSAMLEHHQLVVVPALGGSEALALLPEHPDTAAVLMDIMMPEMDGYETTRRLRRLAGFSDLPVIALTAKAMPGDRELCLAAGCSDYLCKPVSADQLLAMLRGWIYR